MPNQVLINPDDQAQSLTPEAAQEAIKSGYKIPLNDPDGNPVSVPFEQAQQLVQEGYSQPSAQQLKSLLTYAKHSTPLEQVKTLGEGLLEGATFGIGPRIEAAILDNKQEILDREQVNPGVHLTGEIGSVFVPMGAPALTASLAGKAGIKAAGAGGKAIMASKSIPMLTKAAEAGIDGAAEALLAAKSLAKTATMGQKMAASATSNAIEGGVFAGGHELNEALLGDPEQNAAGVIANIGTSIALGGGLGLAFAPIAKGAEKTLETGKKLTGMAGLDDIFDASLKEHAPEVVAAMERRMPGVAATPGQQLKSKGLQKIEAGLAQSVSPPAFQLQAHYEKIHNGGIGLMDEALGVVDDGVTRATTGEAVKDGLTQMVEAEYKPVRDLYDFVKAGGNNVAVADAEKQALRNGLHKIDGLTTASGKPISSHSPEWQYIKRYSDDIMNVETVDELRMVSEAAGREAYGTPQLKYAAGQLKKLFAEAEERAVLNVAEQAAKVDPAAAQQIKGLLAHHAEAKKLYGAIKDKAERFLEGMGGKARKGEGIAGILEKIENTPAEKVADGFFKKNDSAFLSYIKQHAPEQAKMIADLHKSKIREVATRDGRLRPNIVLEHIKKMDPEVRDFLFTPEELAKLKDARTILESVPEIFNPSRTSELREHQKMIPTSLGELGFLAANGARDWAKVKYLERQLSKAGGDNRMMNGLLQIRKMTLKTADTIDKGAAGVFGEVGREFAPKDHLPALGGRAIGGHEMDRKKEDPLKGINKLGPQSLNFINNPESLMEHLSEKTAALSDVAPSVSMAFQSSVARAVNFLASKVPQAPKLSPLDAQTLIPPGEINKFNRYAHVVDEPISVLHDVKDGTLLPQDIEALSAVHPALYKQMKMALTEKLTDALAKNGPETIPYKTRIALGMFLGQNLDSTMMPQAIQATQMAMTSQPQGPQNQASPSKAGMRNMDSISNDMTRAQATTARHQNS